MGTKRAGGISIHNRSTTAKQPDHRPAEQANEPHTTLSLHCAGIHRRLHEFGDQIQIIAHLVDGPGKSGELLLDVTQGGGVFRGGVTEFANLAAEVSHGEVGGLTLLIDPFLLGGKMRLHF